jgi:hypothetical protein
MPLTATQRTANLRARRKAAGWSIVHCQIPADATSILAGAVKKSGLTKGEVVTRLIRVYGEQFG